MAKFAKIFSCMAKISGYMLLYSQLMLDTSKGGITEHEYVKEMVYSPTECKQFYRTSVSIGVVEESLWLLLHLFDPCNSNVHNIMIFTSCMHTSILWS